LLSLLFALLAGVSVGLFVACGDDGVDATPTGAGTAGGSSTAVAVQGEVVVYAAASLTDAFKEAGTKFQERYPNARVTFNFASSSALATQINEGAPADIFASADAVQMKVVTDKGSATSSSSFATNGLVIIVPKTGAPVVSFGDLAKPGLRLVLAAPEVPVGRYSRDMLANASKPGSGISADFAEKALANLKSNEANVRAVLTKVQLGEADAGIVYSTDAAIAANDVTVIAIPAAYNVLAQYPIAVLKEARNAAGAQAWLAFITGTEGQAILARYGFGKP